MQSVLRCGTKNAQSAAAAREYFEKRYPSSSWRQVAEGLLKGLSVCTGCTAAPQWPLDLSPPSKGIGSAKLKMEALRSARGDGGADRLRTMGIEDIVDMETDVFQVLRTASVVLLCRRATRHARCTRSTRALLACLCRTNHVFCVLQDNFVRYVRMAGVMAYELEDEWNLELPASGAWSCSHPRAGGEETTGICVFRGLGGVRDVSSAPPLAVGRRVKRVLRVLNV